MKFISHTLILVLLAAPGMALAQASPIVPCDGVNTKCGFDEFIILLKNIVNFAILYLATPLAAVSFAIAGIMMFTSGGNETQLAKAKAIFKYVLIGLVIALAAWLIVHAIFAALASSNVPSYF